MESRPLAGMMELRHDDAVRVPVDGKAARISSRSKFLAWRAGLTTSQRWVLISTLISTISLPTLVAVGLQVAARDLIFR